MLYSGSETRLFEKFPQVTNVLLGQHGAVMGSVNRTLHTVQDERHPRPMSHLKLGTQGLQQRFNVAPVDIATGRLLLYCL